MFCKKTININFLTSNTTNDTHYYNSYSLGCIEYIFSGKLLFLCILRVFSTGYIGGCGQLISMEEDLRGDNLVRRDASAA